MEINKNLKVVLIGPTSYVGGVSIHMSRLEKLLKNIFLFSYIDETPKSVSKNKFNNIRDIRDIFKVMRQVFSANLIHIHSGNWLLRIYILFVAVLLNKNFIITLHSYRISNFKKIITSIFLKKANCIIAVNNEIKEKLPKAIQKKTLIKEAFIPPSLDNEKKLEKDILNVINKHNKDRLLICVNAYRLIKYKEKELYGFDQCIDVALMAKKDNQNLHIFFVIATIKESDRPYYDKFIKFIELNNLNSYLTVIPKSISFINLIKECDLVLRPTISDGDALTIREALWLNKHVVASDVVKRPPGTILYKNGDSIDLYNKIINFNNNKNNNNLNISSNSMKNYSNFYTKLYIKCSS